MLAAGVAASMTITEKLVGSFRRNFADDNPRLVSSPGRVNLIGEHTDYNDGWVLPMAIDRALWIAFAPREDDRVEVVAEKYDERATFQLTAFEKSGPRWAAYIKGVAHALQSAGIPLRGWRGVIGSDIPVGAGLSSSAALELAVARVFAAVSAWDWHPHTAARLCRWAETEWVGVQCGIMDQLASAAGVAGSALLIDCRSLEITPVPLPAGASIVVMDTGVTRALAETSYNERHRECVRVAEELGVGSLRDLDREMLCHRRSQLDEHLRRRAWHVVSENERALHAADALRAGDLEYFGELLRGSHASLRDDFEVSCPELDILVRCAERRASCFGARMTGAGFGGCAIACVRSSAVAAFLEQVGSEYSTRAGIELRAWPCRAAHGTTLH